MDPHRPSRTSADYIVIGINPVLIMVLVGSLSFFLVEVFYRGEAVGSVRWVIFWFVLAVVLVCRIGIEQSSSHATVYGIALAAATWLYLMRIHPAYLLGVLLLAIVWWSAHQLTRDCTLIDEDEDASGHGLLQLAWWKRRRQKEAQTSFRAEQVSARVAQRPAKPKAASATPHPPGVWLVYFSLAALPLFGIGQALLPAGDEVLRRRGFVLLFIYMAATLGLLLTTSFLGLRRYLRQRHLQMPTFLALGWLRFGVGLAAMVLTVALLLPRPGANQAWHALRYHLDYQLRRASEYAMRFNPHGSGAGRAGNDAKTPGDQADRRPTKSPEGDKDPRTYDRDASKEGPPQAGSQLASSSAAPASALYALFKILLLMLVAAGALWWLIRRRALLAQMFQALIAAVMRFLRTLFSFHLTLGRKKADAAAEPRQHPFAAYRNPFATGEFSSWPPEQLILYSFEALRAWAREQEIEVQPQQTARELCRELGERFPVAGSELNSLAFLYGHAAYATRLPQNYELDSIRRLWNYLSSPLAASPASQVASELA